MNDLDVALKYAFFLLLLFEGIKFLLITNMTDWDSLSKYVFFGVIAFEMIMFITMTIVMSIYLDKLSKGMNTLLGRNNNISLAENNRVAPQP